MEGLGLICSLVNIFPQGVLNTVTSIGGMACDRGAGVCSEFEAELPLCSVVLTTLLKAGSAPRLLDQQPWEFGSRWLVPFKCVFFSSPHTGDFAPVKEMLKLVELVTLESHMDCLCRYLWLCSDAAHGCVFPPILLIINNYSVFTRYQLTYGQGF